MLKRDWNKNLDFLLDWAFNHGYLPYELIIHLEDCYPLMTEYRGIPVRNHEGLFVYRYVLEALEEKTWLIYDGITLRKLV